MVLCIPNNIFAIYGGKLEKIKFLCLFSKFIISIIAILLLSKKKKKEKYSTEISKDEYQWELHIYYVEAWTSEKLLKCF